MTAVQPALLIALGLGIQGAIAAPAHTKLVIPEKIEFLLEDYCFSCHEDGLVKGDVRLDNLDTLTLDARLDLLNRMQEQVYFNQMPPKKKDQPSVEERSELGSWIAGELHVHQASKLEEKLRYPAYGNAVDHEKLFGGGIAVWQDSTAGSQQQRAQAGEEQSGSVHKHARASVASCNGLRQPTPSRSAT